MESYSIPHLSKMKAIQYFSLVAVLFCVSVKSEAQYGSAPHNQSYITPFFQVDLDVELSLTLEDPDNHTYSLKWSVLPTSLRQLMENEELRCYIWDKDSLVAEYSGLHTQQKYCQFNSQSKSVNVIFETRTKIPPPRPAPKQDTIQRIQVISSPLIESWTESWNCDKSEFQAIKLRLEPKTTIKTTLRNNQRIVQLDYVNKGAMVPNEMPQLGCPYRMSLCLDRYYINMRTGRILPGRRWLARKSVRNLIDKTELVLIHPSNDYQTTRKEVVSGREMIKKRKIKLENYELMPFYYASVLAPY